MLEMEPELSSLQRQRDEAQEAALRLQSSVDQLTQVRALLTVCGTMLVHLGKAQEPFQTEVKGTTPVIEPRCVYVLI